MKTKKLDKQMKKDLKAYIRVKQIVLDSERHERMEIFIRENRNEVNIFIETVNINMGGKK